MRYILHIDMNAFFASVEEVLNPELKNLPIAVGGRTSRASVIASPNYIARKYGVKAGMPNFKAKKLRYVVANIVDGFCENCCIDVPLYQKDLILDKSEFVMCNTCGCFLVNFTDKVE